MKVSIDPQKCVGHGICYGLAPEVYVDDDEGYGHVIGDGTVADEEEQAARSGAANCPEQAIAVSG